MPPLLESGLSIMLIESIIALYTALSLQNFSVSLCNHSSLVSVDSFDILPINVSSS